MIRINFYVAIGLYLLFSLLTVLFYFIFKREKMVSYRAITDRRNFWRCNICTYAYINSNPGNFSDCPRCGSINQRI